MGLLQNRTVILTGAAGGIGRATALRCAHEGASLVLCDAGVDTQGRHPDPGVVEEIAREIGKLGAHVVHYAGDMRDASAIDDVFSLAVSNYDTLHAVVHCAGWMGPLSVIRMEASDWEERVNAQLTSAFLITRAAGRRFIAQGEAGGSIVLMSGPEAFFGAAAQASGSALSAGIAALARSSAVELRKHQVRVNVVAPTARTRLTENLPSVARLGEESLDPNYVASVIAFLASDRSRAISGETVGVAGGRVYAIRPSESAGAFFDHKPIPGDLLDERWAEVHRT